jgi:hypothetical protein
LYLFDIAFLRGARFFDIFPATNPTLLGLNVVLSLGTKYLQNVDCVADLAFVAPLTTGTVFNPTNTPAAGTQTLFDEPGTVMNPPSGSVFTWVAYESAYSYVVKAMEAEKAVSTGGVGVTATGGSVTIPGRLQLQVLILGLREVLPSPLLLRACELSCPRDLD